MRIYTENGVDDLMDYRDPIKPNRLNVKVIREMSALEAKDGRCIAMLPYEVAIVERMLREDFRVEAIRAYRFRTGVALKPAKDLAEAYLHEYHTDGESLQR